MNHAELEVERKPIGYLFKYQNQPESSDFTGWIGKTKKNAKFRNEIVISQISSLEHILVNCDF